MSKRTKEKRNKDLVFLVLLAPILFIVIVLMYTLLSNLAEKNKKVCNYIGRIWLEGVASSEDPNPRRGCFTYEELYSED